MRTGSAIATVTGTVPVSAGGGRLLRRRPWGRYGAVLVCLAILVPLSLSVIFNPRIGWNAIGERLLSTPVLDGLLITLELTAISMVLGILIGALLAIMMITESWLLRTIANGYIWVFRGIPLLVQLLLWFNLAALYPIISFGIPGVALDANELISPFVAAVLALSLHEGGYMAEIIRAGLLSVPSGQREAGKALGMTGSQILSRITFPQAVRFAIPPTANQVISMLKTTSLVSVIALSDLLHSVQTIAAVTYQVIPMLLVASIWYLACVSVLSVGQHFLERRFGKGVSR